MRLLVIMIALMTLVGCGAIPTKDPRVVTKYEYVHSSAPTELYNIPPDVPDIDVEKSSQKEVSQWLSRRYKRTIQLETQIIQLKEYDRLAKKRAQEAQEKANAEEAAKHNQ